MAEDPHDVDDMTAQATRQAAELGLAAAGQRIVIVAGLPFGRAGGTNLIRLAPAPSV